MTIPVTQCLLQLRDEHHSLEDYEGGVPRWCNGCGDNAILTAVQRLCRDEGLSPERTVFVSGIVSAQPLHGSHDRVVAAAVAPARNAALVVLEAPVLIP